MKCVKARVMSTTEMSQRRPPNQTLNSDYIVSRNERILVTGSSGFIGSKVVETLLDYGFTNICCFVRPSSQLDRLEKTFQQFDAGKNVEIVTGDLLSLDGLPESGGRGFGYLSSGCRNRKVVCRRLHELGVGHSQPDGCLSSSAGGRNVLLMSVPLRFIPTSG